MLNQRYPPTVHFTNSWRKQLFFFLFFSFFLLITMNNFIFLSSFYQPVWWVKSSISETFDALDFFFYFFSELTRRGQSSGFTNHIFPNDMSAGLDRKSIVVHSLFPLVFKSDFLTPHYLQCPYCGVWLFVGKEIDPACERTYHFRPFLTETLEVGEGDSLSVFISRYNKKSMMWKLTQPWEIQCGPCYT